VTAPDWDGSRYAELNALQRWVAERSLAAVPLRGDERLLDVGCGDGLITAELADRLPHGRAVGIDPSPRMIDVATQRARSNAKLSFTVGAVQAMTFANEFDVVVSFNALHWVADQQLALQRIRAALATGGQALLQLVCAGSRESVEQSAMTVARQDRWARWFDGFEPPFHHPDPDVFAAQAAAAGFAADRIAAQELVWNFGSRPAFLDWCRVGFSDWLHRLPDESARAAFLDEVGTRYAVIAGSAQHFRFLQMTASLRAA
jgi:trans-aconitate 2-methyltransferase